MKPSANELLDTILEHIDVPKSLYEKAAARHRSLGEHLCRDSSKLRDFGPDVRSQGSFRLGTVTRALHKDDEYDLDNVCVLTTLAKTELTQRQIKELYGEEIKTYAQQHGIIAPVEECNRCWRLRFADEENFHLDSLPCVPEEAAVIASLIAAGVPEYLAHYAVAITDRRHPQYDQITRLLLSSNPNGFATWFEQRASLGRRVDVVKEGIRAAVEDVPPYEWKTPLQRGIQLLKRHRDVMFRHKPELAPISMIITNLAARGYEGERDIATALSNMVAWMPGFVRPERPRVPNPADPAEDYADKWEKDRRLEKSFWDWYYAVKSDLARLPELLEAGDLSGTVETVFDVRLTQAELRRLGHGRVAAVAAAPAPAIVIPSAPKPWGQ